MDTYSGEFTVLRILDLGTRRRWRHGWNTFLQKGM